MNEITRETLAYIESNLTDNLNLDQLAKKVLYSKYHFHRIFLKDMGITVTEYLKRRRINQAEVSLSNSNTSITVIALEHGFNNMDSFTRNFKLYYGITPSDYRKLKRRLVKDKKKGCEQGMTLDYQRITSCTHDEKLDSMMTLERMISLSKKAHKEGLLSLEGEVYKDDMKILKKGIELLLKGTEHGRLNMVLHNYLAVTNLTNVEYFQRVIVIKAILMLHEGHYPWDMKTELASYYGEDFMDIFDGQLDHEPILNKFMDQALVQVTKNNMQKMIGQLDKRSLQRTLRECDIILLTIACMGLDKLTKKLIIESLPASNRKNMAQVIEILGDTSLVQVLDAQNSIVAVIQQLRVDGDII